MPALVLESIDSCLTIFMILVCSVSRVWNFVILALMTNGDTLIAGASIPMGQGGHVPPNISTGGT